MRYSVSRGSTLKNKWCSQAHSLSHRLLIVNRLSRHKTLTSCFYLRHTVSNPIAVLTALQAIKTAAGALRGYRGRLLLQPQRQSHCEHLCSALCKRLSAERNAPTLSVYICALVNNKGATKIIFRWFLYVTEGQKT